MKALLATVTERQFTTPEFAGAPEGWQGLLGVCLLLGLGYCVFWLYRREARVGASKRLRTGLACLRCAVLLLLALVWLEPVIATYTIREIAASVAVLTDVSASMTAADADETDARRIDSVNRLLADHDFDWLRRLAANNELQLYAFGSEVRKATAPWEAEEGDTAEAWRPIEATDQYTDIGQAITAILAEKGEAPLAGAIVLSDGGFNQGMSARDAAALAKRLKTPVYAIGAGREDEPLNARIASIAAPSTTAKDDPFEIVIEFDAAGAVDAASRLMIVERESDGEEERVIGERVVRFTGGVAPAPESFEITPERAGEFRYEARLEQISGEAVESDNRRTARVTVIDEKLRVLLVAGRPSFEYRYVTRLYERDKTIDVTCWRQWADAEAAADGDTVVTELPRRPEDLFEYDAVMLFDPDPRDLGAAWAITVRRLADEFGGGVFLQAGPHYTSRFLRDEQMTELISALPITPDPDADIRLSEQGAWRTRGRAVRIPDEALEHPLLRFSADAAINREIWQALPGVWWYLPVLREKPLAAVLLRHGSQTQAARFGQPVLLATQPFGSGRTCFMAYDNTWRWRAAGERYFNRFWIQLARYLGQPRRAGMNKRGAIVLDRETVRPGDFMKIEARVLDEKFVPWHEGEIAATVRGPEGYERELRLEAEAGRAGWYAGRLRVDWTGTATIRLELPGVDERSGKREFLSKHIDAESSDVELRRLAMQKEALAALAEQTGGAYMTLAEAGALPDRIHNASEGRSTRGEDRPLWDKGWVMGLAALMLGAEWGLRRRNHLL